jgi:hypothetical protein
MKLRNYLYATLLLHIFAAGLQSATAEDKFFSAIEDLPRMDGLSEVDGVGVIFDSPSGRIVELLSIGKVNKDVVSNFYSQTLPQLGWTEMAPNKFSREDETLILEFSQTLDVSGSALVQLGVRFILSPAK